MNLLKWRSTAAAAPTQSPLGAAKEAPPGAPPSGPQGVTLQDIVLLKVALSWQEAVAVVAELVGSLSNRNAFPDPAQVTLSDIGEVSTNGSLALPGHPSRAAASMLRELLGGATAPPELRAMVEQNTTTDPRHKTLDEFASALAYFERPGRRGDVAAVYTRAHALYVKAVADLELERLRARATREQVVSEPRPASGVAWQRRALNVVLVVVLCAVIGAGGLTLFSLAFAPAPAEGAAGQAVEPTTPTARLSAATTEMKKLVSTGVEMATSLAGRATAGVAATSGAPPVPPPPARSVRRAGPAPAASETTAVAAEHATTTTAAARRSEAPVEWTVSVRDVTATMNGGVIDEALAPRTDCDSLPLFSLNNDDVTPATLVRPQLPSRMANLGTNGTASTLDLIIDESGRVERAVLDSLHSQVNEKMLVSAAKAWLFQPALRDGQPVRYRLRVQISE